LTIYLQEYLSDLNLIDILCETDYGANVKFHLRRINEEFLSDDIDSFEQAIILLSSNTNY
tara:strand:- start:1753 stop:1932 length:180 start_codon:yes stop_codon:yes gene_type:complete